MTTVIEQLELREKLRVGLALAWQRLVESKKKTQTPLVVIRDGKIVEFIPE